jgi:hypothetical protein
MVRAEIHLIATTDREGRRSPVASSYRPQFWYGEYVKGRPLMSDAAIYFDDRELLVPGETCVGHLHPMEMDRWANFTPGAEIDFFEGARRTGRVRILSVELERCGS